MDIEIIENEAQFNGDILKINGKQIGRCLKGVKCDCLIIQNITIFEEFRSKGYGQILIEKYEEIAKSRGCLKIECEPNDESIKFWEKIGFENIGTREVSIGEHLYKTDSIYQKII